MKFFKIAFRNILKNKTFSIINVIGLAIGMTCTILIFSWVHDELKYDKFHENADDIYRIVFNYKSEPSSGTCASLAPALKEEIPEIESFVRFWANWETEFFNKKNRVMVKGTFTDHSVFEVFRFPFINGNPTTALLESHSLVISESIAEKLFKNKEAIGKTIQVLARSGKKEDFTITGIIKDIPKHSHLQFDFLFSIDLLKEWYRPDYIDSWKSNYSFVTYVTAPGCNDIQNLNRKVTDCFIRHTNYSEKLYLQQLSDIYLSSEVKSLLAGPSGNRIYVRIFIILAVFILIIACINFINISTARASKRSGEIGLQKVVGARRNQLIFQFLGESFLLALMALPLALLLFNLVLDSFNNLTGKTLSLNYYDPVLIIGLFGFICITAFIAGCYPAFYLSSFKPSRIISNKLHSGKKGKLSRNILVTFQFSISIIIIVASCVIFSQLKYISNKNLGFEKENLIYLWASGLNNKIAKQELLKNPNIINVAVSGSQLDFLGWSSGIKYWKGNQSVLASILEVGYDYLNTYDMKIAKGRFYSENKKTDEQESIVVNEKTIEELGIEDPIGKTINFLGKDRTIIGVVNNFHFQSLHNPIKPAVLFLYTGQLRCLGIKIKENDVANTVSYIKNVITKLNPTSISYYNFLDEQLNNLYQLEHQRAKLIGYFAIISILISCLGLFGLISFSVEQSIKEIGVRKVHGAKIKEVIAILNKDIIKWVVISFIFATPFAWYIMKKWLDNFAYKTELSWWIFALAGILALGIALLTVSWQSWMAARRNPVEALRYE